MREQLRDAVREHLGIGVEGEEETPELNEEAEAELDADMEEVAEAAGEAEQAEAVTDELEEVADGMESVLVSMESTVEHGGMDPTAARFAGISVEAFSDRLGIQSPMPALESFGGESECLEATNLGIESIGKKIKEIWDAIKKAVVKAIEAVKNFFAKIFKTTNGVKQQIDSLKKAVKALDKDPEGKIKVPAADKLHDDGKLGWSEIAKGLGEIDKTLNTVLGEAATSAAAMYEEVGKFYGDSKAQSADEEGDIEDATKKVDDAEAKANKAFEAASSGVLLGGKQLYTKADEEAGKVEMGLRDAGKGKVSDAEIDAPSKKEMEAILDAAEKVVSTVEGKKKAVESLQKAREDAMKKAEELVKAGEKGKLGKAWDQAKVNMALRRVNRRFAGQIAKVTSYAMSTVNASLKAVKAGVKAGGGKSEEKEEGDEE